MDRNVDGIERILMDYGSEAFNIRDQWGYTTAHWAALHGNLALIQLLIRNDIPVNVSCFGTQGPKPIHWACRKGHCAVIANLLHVSTFRNTRITSHSQVTVKIMMYFTLQSDEMVGRSRYKCCRF